MKTIIARFYSIDMADLAAKELKERGLVKRNIEIDYENEDAFSINQEVDDEDYLVFPLYSLNNTTTFSMPYFSGIAPYLQDKLINNVGDDDYNDKEVIFCTKCKESNLEQIETVLLSFSGNEIKII